MDLPAHSEGIEVYYDGRCALCCGFAEWLHGQPRAFPVEFVAYQSPRAAERFPGLAALDPARVMVVRTREGGIHRGAEAWVWCLYSSAAHQDLAKRLAGPCLLPVAERVCRLLAANRRRISKLWFRRRDCELRKMLHEMPVPTCGEGCAMPEPSPEGDRHDD